MTTTRPDAARRLVPRWRAFHDAVNTGELGSAGLTKPPTRIASPDFERMLSDWRQQQSLEHATDLICTSIVLGRTALPSVQEAAHLLLREPPSKELQILATKLLGNGIGKLHTAKSFAFAPELAQAQFRAAIARGKRWVIDYPRDATAWTDLARLYAALGQDDHARRCLQVATALAPNNRFVLRSAARFFVHADGSNQAENINQGLRILRAAPALRSDPWLMSAEISLAQIIDAPSTSLKRARSLVEADALAPWHSSEVNGALATFALINGGLGKPSKFFHRSLRAPTENALAQAQWADINHGVISVPGRLFESVTVAPYEALALRHRRERNWEKVIDACRRWSEMEPTSSRPLILGCYVSIAALEDGALAKEFAERAVMFAPHVSWVHNNLAVAHAYLGDIEQAKQHFAKLLTDVTDEQKVICLATEGLISYRSGDRERGFDLYIKAAQQVPASVDRSLRAMVLWHLLREEARIGAPDIQSMMESLWSKTKNLAPPEMESMRDRIAKSVTGPIAAVKGALRRVVGDTTSLPSIRAEIASDLEQWF